MPSQEEYLDNLLKGLSGEEIEKVQKLQNEEEAEDIAEQYTEAEVIDVDDTLNMSAEEIERLLTEAEEADAQFHVDETDDIDLMSFLSNSEDDDLLEIHDILEKSDNNEVIDEEILTYLQEEPEVFDPYADEIEDIGVSVDTEREAKAAQKKRIKAKQRLKEKKEEEAALKSALKSAKKAEAEAVRKHRKEEIQAAKAKKKAEKEALKAVRLAEKEAAKAEKEAELAAEAEEKAISAADWEVASVVTEEHNTSADSMKHDLPGGATVQEENDGMEQFPNLEEIPGMEQFPNLDEVSGIDEFPDLESFSGPEEFGSLEEFISMEEAMEQIPDKPEPVPENPEDADIMELLQYAGDLKALKNEEDDAFLADFESFFGSELQNEEINDATNDETSTDTQNAGSVLREESDKKKKGKGKKSSDASGKKPNVMTRIFEFLTEEDEDEPETSEMSQIQLSDENQSILNDLKKEDKKSKKKKGKKKGKDEELSTEEVKEGEEEKPKKPKKPKKERAPKKIRIPEPEMPGSKLSWKKVLPILLIGATVGVALFIVTNLAGDYSIKRAGREAYYNGDYQTCYENLYGRDLNESEQVMYGKSESILRIRLWLREYELLAEEGLELEALDSLVQSVGEYPRLYKYASEWNAGEDVSAIYQQILDILADKYGLTEAQALAIDGEPDDVEYTRMIHTIVQGGTFGEWITTVDFSEILTGDSQDNPGNGDAAGGDIAEELQDALPEEEDLGGVSFIDNN